MQIGTKSVLFGAHCFFLHPLFVAWAWWKLYGFPCDPRLWASFILHDIGYWGKPNMDGPEGETHPEVGARIMGRLFDRPQYDLRAAGCESILDWWHKGQPEVKEIGNDWRDFTLLHSRYYAKKLGRPFSRLCVADKLACAITPAWLYVPMVCATGEIYEYFANGLKEKADAHDLTAKGAALREIRRGALWTDPWVWFHGLQRYMRLWVETHKEQQTDEWTKRREHADR